MGAEQVDEGGASGRGRSRRMKAELPGRGRQWGRGRRVGRGLGGARAGPAQPAKAPVRGWEFNHPKLIQVLKAVFIGTPTICFIDIKDRL